ncbi:MAG TPA: AmmeMemoRadiSam system protein B [Myxococcaceae bacterium]|nr:AmmeMemoRadiSam system protein B [Myxococcaceae bacterium]
MSSSSVSKVRRPAVAGAFYPGRPEALRSTVDQLVAQAAPRPIHGSLRALIAPHAGYVYSGPIAASAYAVLARASPVPRRVALLGPSHYLGFSGLALPEAEGLETPLGVVRVDPLAASLPERFPQVIRSDRAHQREHSLEVQLPFLQRVLPAGFTVVPLAVGRAGPHEVSEVIEFLWDPPGTLVLVSTDLSHYLPADEAREMDTRTSGLVVAEDFERLDADMACGYHPLAGLMLAARRAGFSIELLDLRNSSDTAGDPDQVVGYGAFAVVEGRSGSG